MPQPEKIMLVDDDADFVAATRVVLEGAGYQVSSASNGSDALALAKKIVPDLVILDVMMTTADEGFELCRKLRQDEQLPQPKIIMLTAIADRVGIDFKDALGDAQWLPADEYLAKPVNPDRLLRTIKRLLG